MSKKGDFMKLLVVAVLSLVGLGASASQLPRDVRVSNVTQDSDSVTVRFSIGSFSAMCGREVQSISISNSDQFNSGEEQVGVIELSLVRNPGQPCLMAFGPDRAVLKLQKGDELPQVAPGSKYRFVINGEDVKEVLVVE
jgi:hypothetical protein